MEINLTGTKEIVIAAAVTVSTDKLTTNRIVELPKEKIVRCFFDELNEPVILWEGAAYDAIGQWTDSDVEARVLELFNV